ncbi:hypothetical protein ACIA03_29220 [Nocardioides sp. NPDC051685]|uniref:hypothetical protein n=1 Tax=Nocardioides sp. NPDC051685 TaxID=3364334 RepID=UPI003798A238
MSQMHGETTTDATSANGIEAAYRTAIAHTAGLLRESTTRLLAAADAAGFESGLHSLALGAELATHDALRILGEGSRAPLANGNRENGETDLEAGVRLLSEAGRALDRVPGELPGVSGLVVAIADLLVEAGDAGRATR